MWNIDHGCVYSNVKGEGYMIHKPFPVDEEVWLTRDGAASGEDDVVNRALEWINNLSYAYDVSIKPYIRVSENDTVTITAQVENPNSHNLSVKARIAGLDGIVADSVFFVDDGNHNDGESGDGIWGSLWPLPSDERTYVVSVTTEDTLAGSLRILPGVVQFTTIGPVTFDDYILNSSDTVCYPGDRPSFKIKLKNNGSTALAPNITAKLIILDTLVTLKSLADRSYGNIAAGESAVSNDYYKISISNKFTNKQARLAVDITSDGYLFWSDTFSIPVKLPVSLEEMREPQARIYPNPTENILNIETINTGQQSLEIVIFTVTGEVVYQKEYKNIESHFVRQIDLSGYAKGIYLVKVKQDRTVNVGKVVVR